MGKYIKNINGINVIKDGEKIVIRHENKIITTPSDEQIVVNEVIYNPSHEQIIEDGWELYIAPIPPEPTTEELLLRSKHEKIYEVQEYDTSREVNLFYIGEFELWLDKATRAGLMLRFQSEQALGKTETTLWYNGIPFPLELTTAFQMLYALENYASMCYDNTQSHIGNINSLSNIEEVEAYDFTTGYPDKLRF